MFRQQLRAILRAQRLRQGAAPDSDGRAPERGAAHARARWRGRASSSTTPAAAYGPVEIGAMVEVPAARADAAGLPAPFRLRLDRHQRPDPVHAGDRPRRRGRRPSLRPLASGGAAAGRRRRSPARARCRQERQRLRRDGRRHRRSRELLLAMGLRSFSMHPSQIVADQASASCATDARRWARRGRRILAADDPERECVAAAGAHRAERARSAGDRACSAAVSATAAIVAAPRAAASGASGLQAHRGLAITRQTGLTGLSKTCQNRGLR